MLLVQQIAALKAQVQRLLSEQATASQPYNITDYLASQGARLYKAAGDFVAQIDTASLRAWAATSWQRVSADASAAWTEIRQHAGTSLDGAERLATFVSAKSTEFTALRTFIAFCC